MKTNRSSPLFYHVVTFVAIAAWSTIELASKFLGPDASPYAITAWRFLIGGLFLLPFALRKQSLSGKKLPPAELLRMAFLGVLIVCVSMLLLQLSIRFGKASLSGVLVGSNPLFVSIFAALILKEKLNLAQGLGLMGGLAGIAVLIAGERDLYGGQYLNLPLSIALALAAALSFGLYAVLGKKTVLKNGNLLTNSFSFVSGAALLFAFGAVTGENMGLELSWQSSLIMLWLGIGVSGIAYLLFFAGMGQLGANQASLYFFLKPMLASGLAVWLLGEELSYVQLLAILVIVAGLALSRLLKRG